MPLDLDVQDAWEPDDVRQQWPPGVATEALFKRLWSLPVELTAAGASGRVLEVAAAEALHACHLAERGLRCTVVEPSPSLLERARGKMADLGVRVELVRGIGEALPFPDGTFDRVLCDSALDHFAAPELGVREMRRVLAPDGRLVLSFVNYASLAARVSRLWYRIDRVRAPATAEQLRFWDSPVPFEHTFECTYRNVVALCGQYLELDRVVGTSMLFGAPAVGRLLRRAPHARALRWLDAMDRVARRVPGLADILFTVWRPRRPTEIAGIGVGMLPRLARLGVGRPVDPPPRWVTTRSSPLDPVYGHRAAGAREFTARWRRIPGLRQRKAGAQPAENVALTGDRTRTWLDLLIERGPFRRAALLGASDRAAEWLRRDASPALDVFDPSLTILQELRHELGPLLHRVGLGRVDLNFLRLGRGSYDVAWSDDGLRDVVNLEYLLDEIARGLGPRGLFAYRGYVGERRQEFLPSRLARINGALREVPRCYRLDGVEAIQPAAAHQKSPFTAERSDEILPLARERFEVVYEAHAAALFPLLLWLDVPALEREAPEILSRLDTLEAEAREDPAVGPALAYVLLRPRA